MKRFIAFILFLCLALTPVLAGAHGEQPHKAYLKKFKWHLIPKTDGDYDIGTDALRIRVGYFDSIVVGTVQGYDYIYIPAAAFHSCTTLGATKVQNEYGANDRDDVYYAFDGGANEERIWVKFKPPRRWDRGTITGQIDWTSAAGSTAGDTCEWGLGGVAIGDSDPKDAAIGTPQVISDILLANGGTDNQTTSSLPAITIGGTPALGDDIYMELYRNTDGTDDMNEDGWFGGVMLEFKIGNAVTPM